jgi:hypothetical protein
LVNKREGISSAVSIINGLDIDLSGGKLITEGGDDLLGEEVEHQPEGDRDGQSRQGAPKTQNYVSAIKTDESLIRVLWIRIQIHFSQRIQKLQTKKKEISCYT